MTERKPLGMTVESWVDKQIREAQERGEFANLPGIGKPIRDLNVPYDEMWWIKQKMAREGLMAMINPVLALRKEAEDALAEAAEAPSERMVRNILEPVNEKITAMLRMPPPGPHLGRKEIDIDEVLREWREAHEKPAWTDHPGKDTSPQSEPKPKPKSKHDWKSRHFHRSARKH